MWQHPTVAHVSAQSPWLGQWCLAPRLPALRLIRHTCRRLVREPLAKNPGLIRRAGSIKQPRIADARDAQRRPGILPCTRICRWVVLRGPHRSCSARRQGSRRSRRRLPLSGGPLASQREPARLPTRRGSRTSARLSKANMSRSTSGARSGRLGFSRQTRRSLCCSNSLSLPRRQVVQACSLTGPP